MTTATVDHAPSQHRPNTAASTATPAASTAASAPAREGALSDATTRLLVIITGVCTLVVLVFFFAVIVILGSNGRAQMSYTKAHPTPKVTRLGAK